MAIEEENKVKVEQIIRREGQEFGVFIQEITWLDTEAGPDIRLEIRFDGGARLLTLGRDNIEFCLVDGRHEDSIRRVIQEMLKKP